VELWILALDFPLVPAVLAAQAGCSTQLAREKDVRPRVEQSRSQIEIQLMGQLFDLFGLRWRGLQREIFTVGVQSFLGTVARAGRWPDSAAREDNEGRACKACLK